MAKIRFEQSSTRVAKDSDEVLIRLAQAMVSHPQLEVLQIEPVASVVGDDRNLAKRRAKALRAALREKGVQVENRIAKGYGVERTVFLLSDLIQGEHRVELSVTTSLPEGGLDIGKRMCATFNRIVSWLWSTLKWLVAFGVLGLPLIVASTTTPTATGPWERFESWGFWLRNTFEKLLPWPAVVLALVGVVLVSRTGASHITQLLSPFRRMKFWGAELVVSEEGAKKFAHSAEEAFAEYRSQVRREYAREVTARALSQKLWNIVTQFVKPILQNKFSRTRCTIHIPDILFTDRLYQLLDYYPGGAGGAGRTKSMRFGIIGRSWRASEDWFDPNVSTDAKQLIEEWGMTMAEAHSGGRQPSRSCACILLRHNDTPVGILYMDHEDMNAFGNRETFDRLAEQIRAACEENKLTRDLNYIVHKLAAPRLAIDDANEGK